jgi:hypothetical protein
MKKKEWVEVRVWRTGKYPRRCTRIRFEMIADGSQCDAVKTLMSYLDIGQYSFVKNTQKATS